MPKDFLAEAVAKKRQELQAAAASAASSPTTATSRFVRKIDLERQREKQYLQDLELEKQEKENRRLQKRRKLDSDNNNDDGATAVDGENSDINASTSSESASASAGTTSAVEQPQQQQQQPTKRASRFSREEIVRRLRNLRQPATLFGETDETREERLRRVEATQTEIIEGQRNDWALTIRDLEQQAATKSLENIGNRRTTDSTSATSGAGGAGQTDDGGVISDDDEEEIPNESNSTTDGPGSIAAQAENVRRFLKKILRGWKQELNSRPDQVRRTNKHKQLLATFVQTRQYIQPLLDDLRNRVIKEDILYSLHEIVESLKQREYVQANDSYLRLSIGNAPWPMGVTMVGIHERSAREKIEATKVAHILNDERTRKYIQSVKRVITKCQDLYPTVPSKTVAV